MKLLFITQKADQNDDILGVYHQWIAGLASKLENISVICLYKGQTDLPNNVTVYSLGKENINTDQRGIKRGLTRIKYVLRFYKYIWRLRNDYDVVFVHMNPEYILFGGFFWKLLGKKIILWYAHYLANSKLRFAALFADKIFTSVRQAYPLKTKKLVVLQQGIDTERFRKLDMRNEKLGNDKFKILFLGRISPVKNLETLLRAAVLLKKEGINFLVNIVGSPTAGKLIEQEYYERIKKMAQELGLIGAVNFLSPVPNYQTPEVYNNHDLFINLTVSGSFDKTTLEAMACGLPVLVSNPAFNDILNENLRQLLIFSAGRAEELFTKMIKMYDLSPKERSSIGIQLRQLIIDQHNLHNLINKIAHSLQ